MMLHFIGFAILILYFAFVLGIGWYLRGSISTSSDFLTAGRNVPTWIASLAFFAANLGAQDVIGMCASGAKYGIMTAHFYWIGAVPAMLFVGVFMMPFYYGSRARSVPEYLKLRFDEKTRGLNAITFAVMTVFSSGISMYALALLLKLILGWDFTTSVLLSALIVLAYTFLGGLKSAIYNEVLQFFLIVLGFAPLAFLAVTKAGGWQGIAAKTPQALTHAWRNLGDASQNPMGGGAEIDAADVQAQPGRCVAEPDGGGGLQHDDGPGLRAQLRLLVYRLPGGATRLGGREHVIGPTGAGACGICVPAHWPWSSLRFVLRSTCSSGKLEEAEGSPVYGAERLKAATLRT